VCIELLSDRFLPEYRSINSISQRYSKLCVQIYKAHGIGIDSEGRLEKPPRCEGIDDVDPIKLASLQPVSAPATLNVHRWSLDEDLTLLRVVPVMGHMWAESKHNLDIELIISVRSHSALFFDRCKSILSSSKQRAHPKALPSIGTTSEGYGFAGEK
jgi:hypothetical protein